MERVWNATLNTWRGLKWAARNEQAFRQEILVLAFAIPIALWVSNDPAERALLIGAVLFVMIIELLNTAIEKLCDRLVAQHDAQIGVVKDLGSAAVGLSIFVGLAVWAAAIVRTFVGG